MKRPRTADDGASGSANALDEGERDEQALREDIRFLGRLLGDTIREQAGAKVFELVEQHPPHARSSYRRDHDVASLRTLERTIGALGQDARHQRRARVQLLPPPGQHRRGSAPATARGQRPTRVRRAEGSRSPLALRARCGAARRRRAAQLVALLRARARRAGADGAPDRGAAQEHPRSPARDHRRAGRPRARRRRRAAGGAASASCGARCCCSGRPASCAPAKPTVADEIENGLAYFRSHVPRGRAAPLRRARGRACGDGRAPGRRSCASRAGSAAIATATRTSPHEVTGARGRAPGGGGLRALPAPRCTRWAASCRSSSRYTAISPELDGAGRALARSRRRAARGAVPARADRHLRAARRDGARAARPSARRGPRARGRPGARPTRAPRSCRPISTSSHSALVDGGARAWPPTGGCATCAAPSRCSASTWRRSTCASTATSTRAWCARSARARPGARRLRGDVDEPERQELLLRELVTAAAAGLAARQLQPTRRPRRCATLATVADAARAASARAADPELRHLDDRRAQRPAGGGAAAQGGGPARARARSRARRVNIIPLFETIDDLRALRRDHGRSCSRCPTTASCSRAAATCRRSCSATRTATRTAASSRRTGSCTRPSARWSSVFAQHGVRPAPVPRPRRHGRPRRRAELPRRARAAAAAASTASCA